jgi:hypothetical protein
MAKSPPSPQDEPPAKRKPGRPKGSPSRSKRIPGEPKKTSFKNISPNRFDGTKRGVPSTYQPDYANIAKSLYENGATNTEVADILGVTLTTVQRWLVQYPDFRLACGLGKLAADDRVERSLFSRAVGYDFDSEKVFYNQKKNKVVRVPIREHVPPDPGAAMRWLTNRRPEQWRDKREIDLTATLTLADLVKASLTLEERERLEPPTIDVTPETKIEDK